MTDLAVRQLSKRFGSVRAVEGLSFDAPAGKVTGFLGPNGAGKTTTLRMLLGLVRPTAGEALIGGVRYERLREPTRTVGAVLEYSASNPGRTGRDQLRVLASVTGVPARRVDEVLEQVDLGDAVNRRVSGYSTGMRQRLGLAAALLGDPNVLVLDEPANGLDPEGIAWLRNLLRSYAADGRTILISSHVLSEIAQTVDGVVIISQGRLRFAGPLAGLGDGTVAVRTGELERLRGLLGNAGYSVSVTGTTSLDVRGATAEEIGRLAASQQIALSGLAEAGVSLEEAFLKLTGTDESSRHPVAAI
ncbi:MAG: ATP-binding cassette domain-containing protein [Candidatus Limnocylindrales bacterium]